MTTYNGHIHRKMRLAFGGIEAAAIPKAEAAGDLPVSGVVASKPVAVAEAKRQALETNEWNDVDPDDLAPLLVTEGRNCAQPLFETHVKNMSLTEGENEMTEGKEHEPCLSRCPLCGGEIQATVERYYSLRGGTWVESGVDGDNRFYCENDCDLSEYSQRIPGIG